MIKTIKKIYLYIHKEEWEGYLWKKISQSNMMMEDKTNSDKVDLWLIIE